MNDAPPLPLVIAAWRRVCARRDWRLLAYPETGLTETEAARQVQQVVSGWLAHEGHAAATDALLDRAVVFVYCRVLHAALGLDHTAAQERACAEIWRHITPIICRYISDTLEAEACANGVLLTVWEKRETLREPGALLSWAALIASHAALKLAQRGEFASLDAYGPDDDEGEAAERRLFDQAAQQQPLLSADALARGDVSREVERGDDLAGFEELIRHCLRSIAQQEVFIRLILHEAAVRDVARDLGITVNHVAVLKHRAILGLAKCRKLLAALGRALAAPAKAGPDVR